MSDVASGRPGEDPVGNDSYVLRSRDREEISRLRHQHIVWKKTTDDVLRVAGCGPGDRLLDIGCGPGFLTLDLAELVGPTGAVLAIDSSPDFVRHLRSETSRRNLSRVRAECADVMEYGFEAASCDGAIFRWVLMFLREPERLIERVVEALRPGAALAVLEYMQFRTMSLWPGGDSFARVYGAVHELIERSGGDADIGGRIPGLVQQAGLEIIDLQLITRVGRPGSALWEWLEATGKNHINLVEAGLITDSELEAYHDEWRRHSADPSAFFTSPPVLATIARRP